MRDKYLDEHGLCICPAMQCHVSCFLDICPAMQWHVSCFLDICPAMQCHVSCFLDICPAMQCHVSAAVSAELTCSVSFLCSRFTQLCSFTPTQFHECDKYLYSI
jgi:hypothetical protein